MVGLEGSYTGAIDNYERFARFPNTLGGDWEVRNSIISQPACGDS